MNASGVRWIGFALIFIALALGLEATTFEVAFLTDPVGPKALPLLAAILLAGAGVHAWARPPTNVTWPDRSTAVRMAVALIAFATYAIALPSFGFFLSTTAVVAVLSYLYGAAVRQAVLAAASLSAVMWVLFVQLLALPLPIGSLWIR